VAAIRAKRKRKKTEINISDIGTSSFDAKSEGA